MILNERVYDLGVQQCFLHIVGRATTIISCKLFCRWFLIALYIQLYIHPFVGLGNMETFIITIIMVNFTDKKHYILLMNSKYHSEQSK